VNIRICSFRNSHDNELWSVCCYMIFESNFSLITWLLYHICYLHFICIFMWWLYSTRHLLSQYYLHVLLITFELCLIVLLELLFSNWNALVFQSVLWAAIMLLVRQFCNTNFSVSTTSGNVGNLPEFEILSGNT